MFPGRDPRAPRRASIIDPACAICSAPASAHCKCEATALETAVLQAEDHEMAATYEEIRAWVKDRARDYILQYFRQLSEPRKTAHSANLDRITAEAMYYHNQPPSPRQLAEAEALHRQSIDEDWKASVQRYPEVLRYYFSLVHPSLPADDDPSVKDPPLNGLTSPRKMRRRQPPIAYPGHEGGPPPAPQIPYGASMPPQIRDVPHMGRMTTPGPPPQRRPRPPSGYRYSAPPLPPGPGYTYYG